MSVWNVSIIEHTFDDKSPERILLSRNMSRGGSRPTQEPGPHGRLPRRNTTHHRRLPQTRTNRSHPRRTARVRPPATRSNARRIQSRRPAHKSPSRHPQTFRRRPAVDRAAHRSRAARRAFRNRHPRVRRTRAAPSRPVALSKRRDHGHLLAALAGLRSARGAYARSRSPSARHPCHPRSRAVESCPLAGDLERDRTRGGRRRHRFLQFRCRITVRCAFAAAPPARTSARHVGSVRAIPIGSSRTARRHAVFGRQGSLQLQAVDRTYFAVRFGIAVGVRRSGRARHD